VIGARMVESWGSRASLAQGARTALAKIATALPKDKRARWESSPLFSPGFAVDPRLDTRIDSLRAAVDGRRYILLSYQDAEGAASERRVRSLALVFWGEQSEVVIASTGAERHRSGAYNAGAPVRACVLAHHSTQAAIPACACSLMLRPAASHGTPATAAHLVTTVRRSQVPARPRLA